MLPDVFEMAENPPVPRVKMAGIQRVNAQKQSVFFNFCASTVNI